jgi:hypothetical protein
MQAIRQLESSRSSGEIHIGRVTGRPDDWTGFYRSKTHLIGEIHASGRNSGTCGA